MVIKTTRKRVVVAALLFNLLLSSCGNYSSNESLSSNNASSETTRPEQGVYQESDTKVSKADRGYKLYFGEWEITSIIAENLRFGSEAGAEDFIGTFVYFDLDNAKAYPDAGSEAYTFSPQYEISIVPNSNTPYFDNMPSFMSIGATGAYNVVVRVGGYQHIDFVGAYIVLVDDETIVFYSNEVFYKAVRTAHAYGRDDGLYTAT